VWGGGSDYLRRRVWGGGSDYLRRRVWGGGPVRDAEGWGAL